MSVNVKANGTTKTLLQDTDLAAEEIQISMAPVTSGSLRLVKIGKIVIIDGRYVLQLSSAATAGSTYSASQKIPMNFRPTSDQILLCICGLSTHFIRIATDGTVVLTANANQSAGGYIYGINGAYNVA